MVLFKFLLQKVIFIDLTKELKKIATYTHFFLYIAIILCVTIYSVFLNIPTKYFNKRQQEK